ncbi:MAG: antibiotic biosynthesis monooxygenase [Acidobacteriia bacterium]|nr:antibiotic biosynthesis monooxygenase [Terriglobia bacterium]
MSTRTRKKAAPRRSQAKSRARKARARRGAKLPKSAVTLMVILRAKEGQATLLEAELRALVAPTRREEGCLRFDLYRAADAPGAFFLHEVWARREDHTRHTNMPHFLRWSARKDAVLASRESAFWTQIL